MSRPESKIRPGKNWAYKQEPHMNQKNGPESQDYPHMVAECKHQDNRKLNDKRFVCESNCQKNILLVNLESKIESKAPCGNHIYRLVFDLKRNK